MAFAESQDGPLLQAAAIPYRRREARIEFCVVTTASGRRWGFPKGIIDPGETDRETALKESHEEAGLSGQLAAEPLGTFEYSKWNRSLTCTAFLMQVDEAADEWDEQSMRQRQWCTRDQLAQLEMRDYWLPLVDTALERLA